MRLFIAEKESQAKAIADGLSARQVPKSHFILCGDTETDIVTWANGHLYERPPPEYYNPKFEKWLASDLPILPPVWRLVPRPSGKRQLDEVNRLLEKADTIVHSCDFDREGQAIGDEILQEAPKLKQGATVQRLILRGLSKPEVQIALSDLHDNADFYALGQSAVARSILDWIVGFNMTRAYTLAAQASGHSETFNVGRVMTPTLALIVKRDRAIDTFEPIEYFQTVALITHSDGQFIATWRPKDGTEGLDDDKRLRIKAVAEAMIHRVKSRSGRVSVSKKEAVVEKPPLPHDLTTLQIQANEKHGITALNTLQAAQSLYDKQLLSYPRPNCRFLPESQHADALSILRVIAKNDPNKSDFAANANPDLRSDAWDDSRVGAHHGIIPLSVVRDLGKLTDDERCVYDLVCRRYIAQFYEPVKYLSSTVECLIANEIFEAKQRDTISPGWKLLYPAKSDKPSERPKLPACEINDKTVCTDIEIIEKKTTPAQRFTDATLIAAMENIEKHIEDDEERKAVSGAGIGTDATRADHINNLIKKNFVARNNRQLISTRHGREIIDSLPGELTSPSLTAVIEQMLEKIAEGDRRVDAFLSQQSEFVRQMVATATVKRRVATPEEDAEGGGGSRTAKTKSKARVSYQRN